ncbi:hypothetical protein AVEN_55481-1, partial [Araneus ventricosus]
MYAAFWLAAFLLNCQSFFSVSSDTVLDGSSPTIQLRRDLKPLSLARRMVPKVEIVVPPFVKSDTYIMGSRKQKRHIRSENEPAFNNEEPEESGIFEPLFVKSNA